MPTGQADRLMPTLRRVVLARQSAARSDGDLLGAFVTARDAEAFAELVRRHGPMVLGVCRRVVGDRTTAEDAFQAVFLVLARRAAAVRPREQVGSWLYGVAYRTALKARTVLARRRSREKQVDVMPEPTATATSPPAWNDLQPVIDEELARLPDKLRLPVVLCDLEGRPQREVAKHLNVPPATLATRLATARRTLAQRLTRRGVTLSGGALAGLLGVHAAAKAVPPALSAALTRAVEAVATGTALNSLVSANALQLSEGVMRMMMLAKLKAVAVMAVTALALTTGLGLGLVPAAAGDDPTPAPATGGTATPKPAHAPPAAAFDKATLEAAKLNDPDIDDATFLRRLCLDVRGTVPTPVELWFFISDPDTDKRAKLVEWLTDDDDARARLAKKLGVPVEEIRVLRLKATVKGKYAVVLSDVKDSGFKPDVEVAWATGENSLNALAGTLIRPAVIPLQEWEQPNAPATLGNWLVANGEPKTVKLNNFYVWKQPGKPGESGPPNTFFKGLDVGADGKDTTDHLIINNYYAAVDLGDSDTEFLKRVLTDVRGSGPTALELKYFTEDKDARKREKLIDTLLKDPAVQKKLGGAWKAKMLAPKEGKPATPTRERLFLYFVPDKQPPQPDKFEKLVGELIAAKKSDEAILESLTLATLGRLPTDSEKKLTLAGIASAKDRKSAWVAVAKAMAGVKTAEVERTLKLKFSGEQPPVPPARP